MRLRDWAFFIGGVSSALLVYGSLHEAKRTVYERKTLPLPHWPERLRGFRIALLTDLHIQGDWSLKQSQRAVQMVLDEDPDMVVISGDIVDRWRPGLETLVTEALEPLIGMNGNVVAVPGNHDYYYGSADRLTPVLDRLNIKYLRNEVWVHQGISWVGIDSAVEKLDRPIETMAQVVSHPAVVVWHEPDVVGRLPEGASLMLSGHSHGGQFRFPGGITPKHPRMGRIYTEGFYPNAPTPIYVSRGVGVTGPPSRFLCPPEVSILELVPLIDASES